MNRLLVTCDFPSISGGQSTYFKNHWTGLSSSHDTLPIPSLSRYCCNSNKFINARFSRLFGGERFLPRVGRLVGLIFAMSAAARAAKPDVIHAG